MRIGFISLHARKFVRHCLYCGVKRNHIICQIAPKLSPSGRNSNCAKYFACFLLKNEQSNRTIINKCTYFKGKDFRLPIVNCEIFRTESNQPTVRQLEGKNIPRRRTIAFCLHIVPTNLLSVFLYAGNFQITYGYLPTRFSSFYIAKISEISYLTIDVITAPSESS